MYERVYYPLTPLASDVEIGMVVDIDRTTGTPTVTLRSPLQVCVYVIIALCAFCVAPSTLDSLVKWIISRLKLPLNYGASQGALIH